jgi:hypothetical protein
MHGDNRHTLRPQCHEQIEAEANFAAGRLLFLRDRFAREARDLPTERSSVQSLHASFGMRFQHSAWRHWLWARACSAAVSGSPSVDQFEQVHWTAPIDTTNQLLDAMSRIATPGRGDAERPRDELDVNSPYPGFEAYTPETRSRSPGTGASLLNRTRQARAGSARMAARISNTATRTGP